MDNEKQLSENRSQQNKIGENMLSFPKVVKLDEKNCIGYVITTSVLGDRKKRDIPPFFHEVYDNNKLAGLWDNECRNMYCIFDMHSNGADFDYYIATDNKAGLHKNGYAHITIKEAEYVTVELLKKNHTAVSEIMMFLRGQWMGENG